VEEYLWLSKLYKVWANPIANSLCRIIGEIAGRKLQIFQDGVSQDCPVFEAGGCDPI
jgi:hypothetical protein